MKSDRTRELHPAFPPSDSSASALAKDPWTGEFPELSHSELVAFLEDFPGQLATVTTIAPPAPRRFERFMKAIARGFDYFIRSLEDLTDVYDL